MRSLLRDMRGGGRTIRGSVGSGGAVLGGTGFRVTKTGTGTYNITFLQPFAAPPIVVASGDSNNRTFPFVYNRAAGGFTLGMMDESGGVVADRDFMFIAMEQG